MKKYICAIGAMLLVALAPAADEKAPRFTPECLQELTAPIQEKEIQLISEPNSKGQRIIVFHRDGNNSEWNNYLALKEADGAVRFFYCFHVNVQAPEVTQQIMWLDDTHFACVCSGRRHSLYGVYEMDSAADDEYPALHLLYPVATGAVHMRMTWRVQGKALIGGIIRIKGSSGEEELVEVIRISPMP
ncbi:MAG: hypothetical protein J1E42_00895 [Akkermansiaceae bacterium]|nr:hypothetical protein [Akkermansiaceae bacterium]